MLELDKLFHEILGASRKKVFKRFIEYIEPQSGDIILDLGAAGDYYGERPFFEDNYKYKENIIGVNIDINELVSLRRKYKEILIVLADGCYLPFKSESIDIVFSNAVLEHVGDLKRQKKFANEIMRVGKKWYVTTPNFCFPIETHWKLPFIHFIPIKLQRPLARYFKTHGWYGDGYYLLSARKLKKLFPTSKIKKQRTTFYPEVLIAYSPVTHETKKENLDGNNY